MNPTSQSTPDALAQTLLDWANRMLPDDPDAKPSLQSGPTYVHRKVDWPWTRAIRKLVGWGFAYASFALPLKRVAETPRWLAFEHPRPKRPLHLVVVPKVAAATLSEVPLDGAMLAEGFQLLQDLVHDLELEEAAYRIVIPGGSERDLPQFSLHLMAD